MLKLLKSLLPRSIFAASLVLLVAPAAEVRAVEYFWVADTGDWDNGANWNNGQYFPEAEFEEEGVINNGGVALLDNPAPDAAGLRLGVADGEDGTLRILSGGQINFVDSTGDPLGIANIAIDGSGTLEVQGGGSFSTTSLDVNALGNVIIGEGSGAASVVSTGGMFLGGTTVVNGPGHTFEAAGGVNLEGSGVYNAVLTAGTHTALSTPGTVNLGGELRVDYGDGFSGSVGDSWTLFEAGAVNGGFASVTGSAIDALQRGQTFRVSNLGELVLDIQAILSVDSVSGAAKMSSPGGDVGIVGYSVLSPSGQLSVDDWNSLADDSTPNWDEAGPTATSLNELYSDPGSSFTLGASEIDLGTPWAKPSTFGESPDLSFEYVNSDNEVIEGLVEITGPRAANNLLLTVDPDTGEAQLANSSQFSISLVGYSVLSDSDSLAPGEWVSLDDQGVGDFDEAAPTAGAISELISGAGLTLSPGQSFSLGDLFDEVAGERDLALEFALDGESTFRTGVVDYGAIIASPAGDYNNDGVVNAIDFAVWRENVGQPDGALPNDGDLTGVIGDDHYDLWAANYGLPSSSSSAEVAVPEPASAAALSLGLLLSVVGSRSPFGRTTKAGR